MKTEEARYMMFISNEILLLFNGICYFINEHGLFEKMNCDNNICLDNGLFKKIDVDINTDKFYNKTYIKCLYKHILNLEESRLLEI